MKDLYERFNNYYSKLDEEVDSAMARSKRLHLIARSLQEKYADLISRTDEENRLYVSDTQPIPVNTSDPLYRRLCLIQHQVRTKDKDKVKPESKKDYILDIVDFFLYHLQRDIKERRLDERTYNELSRYSDFEVRDLYLREAEKIFNEEFKKQGRFFKNYLEARLDSQMRVTALFQPKPKKGEKQ